VEGVLDTEPARSLLAGSLFGSEEQGSRSKSGAVPPL
jgi:hypothetical protein